MGGIGMPGLSRNCRSFESEGISNKGTPPKTSEKPAKNLPKHVKRSQNDAKPVLLELPGLFLINLS